MDESQNMMMDALLSLPEDYSIVEEQVLAYARAAPSHDKWAQQATLCTNFVEDNQWTDAERAKLKDERRPCETFNRVKPLFNLLTGYQAENRYETRYTPENNGTGSESVAEALTAISKQVDEDNQLPWLESQVFADGLRGHRGYFDCRMDYSRNFMGDVRIMTEDPFSILIDREAESYDPNDRSNPWLEFTKTAWMSPTDILLLYGQDKFDDVMTHEGATGYPIGDVWTMTDVTSPGRYFGLDDTAIGRFDFNTNIYGSPTNHVNMHRKLIRVLDRQHRRLKKMRWFLDLQTGDERLIPDEWDNNKIARVLQYFRATGLPIDVRTGHKRMVRWTVTAGSRVLWDKWSPYEENMTLVPYFAYFRRGKTGGFVDSLISPQREINIRRSNLLHAVMTMANSGWIVEDDSLTEDSQDALEQHGAKSGIIIKHRRGTAAPVKITPNQIPPALRYMVEKPEGDIKEISGVNDSALGNLDRAQSGVAVKARQKQTIVAANGYFDNLSRSRELLGRLKQYMVQRFYTDERVIKGRAGEGADEDVVINVRTAAGAIRNNITVGTYRVAIDEQPLSATFAEGQQAELMEFIKNGMPIAPTDWDLVLENSTIANKEDFIKRFQENRALQIDQQLIADLIQRLQAGLQPGQPLPGIQDPEVLAGTAPVVAAPSNTTGATPI